MSEALYYSIRVMGSTQDHHFRVSGSLIDLTPDWLIVRENSYHKPVFAAPTKCVYLLERIWK